MRWKILIAAGPGISFEEISGALQGKGAILSCEMADRENVIHAEPYAQGATWNTSKLHSNSISRSRLADCW